MCAASTWSMAASAIGNMPPQQRTAIREGKKAGIVRERGWFDDCRTNVAACSKSVEPGATLCPVDLHQPDTDELDLTTVLQALGDPVRLKIVRALAAEGEQACGSMELGISKSTRSHHFKTLREAGVTYTRIEGTHRHVSLR